MSKQPIEWHRNGIDNTRSYIDSKKADIARLQAEVDRSEEDLRFREHQLAKAQDQGLSHYDAQKFLVTRKKREAECGKSI